MIPAKGLTVSKTGVLIRASIPAGDSWITVLSHCPPTCYFKNMYFAIYSDLSQIKSTYSQIFSSVDNLWKISMVKLSKPVMSKFVNKSLELKNV